MISILVDTAVPVNLYSHMLRKSIYNRRTYTVKTAAGLICVIVKFSACMKGGKYHSGCRHSFFMHFHRNTTSVIPNGTGAVFFQADGDLGTETSQMLVHCIVHDLIDQVVQPLRPNSSNIHTRPFPDCLQSFQDGYTVCIVLFLCHFSLHIALCSLAIFLHCYLMTKKNLIETRLLSVSQLYSKSF